MSGSIYGIVIHGVIINSRSIGKAERIVQKSGSLSSSSVQRRRTPVSSGVATNTLRRMRAILGCPASPTTSRYVRPCCNSPVATASTRSSVDAVPRGKHPQAIDHFPGDRADRIFHRGDPGRRLIQLDRPANDELVPTNRDACHVGICRGHTQSAVHAIHPGTCGVRCPKRPWAPGQFVSAGLAPRASEGRGLSGEAAAEVAGQAGHCERLIVACVNQRNRPPATAGIPTSKEHEKSRDHRTCPELLHPGPCAALQGRRNREGRGHPEEPPGWERLRTS